MYMASKRITLSTSNAVDIPLTINIGSANTSDVGLLRVDYQLSTVYTVAQDFELTANFTHECNAVYGTGDYVAGYSALGNGSKTVYDYNDPKLGDTVYFDTRLFDSLEFRVESMTVFYDGELEKKVTEVTPWTDWGVSAIKNYYDQISYNGSKILWNYYVTIWGDYFNYRYTGAIRLANVTGWETVQGSGVGSESGGSGVVM